MDISYFGSCSFPSYLGCILDVGTVGLQNIEAERLIHFTKGETFLASVCYQTRFKESAFLGKNML